MNDKIEHIQTCEKLLKYDRNMRSIRYHINAILSDLALQNDGWRINYAIDFSVIHDFIFGFYELLKSSTGKNGIKHKKIESFIQKNAGMDYLFNMLKNDERLILLPSYAFELGYFINNRRNPISIKPEIQFSKFETFLHQKNQYIAPLSELYNFKKENSDVEPPDALIEKCLSIITKEFDEIFFLWLYEADHNNLKSQGFKRLRNLFERDKNKIQFINDIWPKITKTLNTYANNFSSKWLEMFKAIRNRINNDVVDSEAIDIIYSLNTLLNKNKEIVLLVSDAPTMTRVLNWDLIGLSVPSVDKPLRGLYNTKLEVKDYLFPEYRILRTPRTFLFYIMCSGENRDSFLLNAEKWSAIVSQYFSMTSTIVNDIKEKCKLRIDIEQSKILDKESAVCQGCNVLEKDNKLNDIFDHYTKIESKLSNIQLFLNKEEVVAEEIGKRATEELVNDKISSLMVEFVINLNDRYKYFKEKLLQKKDELSDELMKINNTIGPTIVDMAGPNEILQFKTILEEYLSIFDRIEFQNKEIKGISKEISLLNYQEPDPPKLKIIISKMLQLTQSSKEDFSEVNLLKASLSYLAKEYDYCIDLLRSELSGKNPVNYYGLKYLYGITLFRQSIKNQDSKIFNLCIEEIQNLVSQFPTDPRSCHLLGFVSLEAKERMFTRELFDSDVKEIINLLEESLKLNPKKRLSIKILNNIAYCLYKYGEKTKDNANYARTNINKIIELESDVKNWTPQILDTAACVLLLNAQYSEMFKERKSEIELAIKYLNEAITQCKFSANPSAFIADLENHKLEAIKMQKRNLPYD